MKQSVLVNGHNILLDPARAIGKGGEADVYDIGRGLVLKVFKDERHPDYDGQPDQQRAARDRIRLHQTKLREFPKQLPSHVVVPETLATDQSGNMLCGYTMKFLAGAEVLMRYGDKSFRQAGISNEMVVAIFRDLHQSVLGIHQAGVVIGDFNDLNVLVLGTDAHIIDADSFQFGKYPCKMFTARFVDPLHCDPLAKSLQLKRPHTADSDWYSYAIMLMQSLLFVDPYGGVYIPKNKTKKIPHPQRPLQRITVFHPEVRYPKPATPYGVLSDELLQFFHELFEKDKRGEFPLKLLEMRWTNCINCGTIHARNICPECTHAAPTTIKVVTVHGQVVAKRIFTTSGLILHAAMQAGKLRYLIHENGQYKREDGQVVLSGKLDPQMRFRIRGDATLLGKGNRLITLVPGESPSSLTVDTVGLLPIFDANYNARYWVTNGDLRRDGAWDESEAIGQVLPGQTLFWVGQDFGFGFYRASALSVAFVFDAKQRGLNDNVALPPIRGQLIDSTCFFSGDLCWFLTSTREQGKTLNTCTVINRRGDVVATAQTDTDDGSWLGTLRGKAATGNSLLAATDLGIVRVDIDNGQIHQSRHFPDTEPFVSEQSHLFLGGGGIFVANTHDITHLKIT